MEKKILLNIAAACGFLSCSAPALAYVGPGAGLSAIGSILAFVGVLFLMIAGFVWYPVKRLISRFRKQPEAGDTADQESQ